MAFLSKQTHHFPPGFSPVPAVDSCLFLLSPSPCPHGSSSAQEVLPSTLLHSTPPVAREPGISSDGANVVTLEGKGEHRTPPNRMDRPPAVGESHCVRNTRGSLQRKSVQPVSSGVGRTKHSQLSCTRSVPTRSPRPSANGEVVWHQLGLKPDPLRLLQH